MQTRRDQFQAYKYLVRRVLASMIGNDPEAPEQPMRRVGGATAIGILFGGLACGGVAVYGWLVGSISDNWMEQNNIVVREKATGAQFVYMLNGDSEKGELRPVPNFTSAQLLTQSADPTVKKLTAGSLNDVPKGTGIGIPNAPALLPAVEDLAPTPWAVCSRPQRESDRNKQTEYQTDVVIGRDDIGADKVGDNAVVVHPEGDDQQLYVLYNGKRLAATDQAVNALDFRDQPVAVSPTLLNAIPEGQALAGPQLQNAGQPGTDINGQPTVIGQVFEEEEQESYWIMDANGPRQLDQVQANLLLAPGGGAQAPGGVEQTEATKAPQSELQNAAQGVRPMEPGDLPTEYPLTAPDLADDASADTATVCAWYDGTGRPELTVNGNVPKASPAAEDAAASARDGSGTGALLADHTIVQSGAGAVVGVEPQGGGNPSVFYVVTDNGKRYQMSKGVLSTLGYSGEEFDPPTLPSHLVKLIPEGPALSPEAAKQTWAE